MLFRGEGNYRLIQRDSAVGQVFQEPEDRAAPNHQASSNVTSGQEAQTPITDVHPGPAVHEHPHARFPSSRDDTEREAVEHYSAPFAAVEIKVTANYFTHSSLHWFFTECLLPTDAVLYTRHHQ